jgi:histidinol-phosphate aminotransferase
MSEQVSQFAKQGVAGLTPYSPGKPVDELQRELGIDKVVKLASNENPMGPSQKVLAAIQHELADLTRYPDGNGFYLKQAISEHLGVQTSQITLGNGSNDVLDLIARTFLSEGDEAIFSQHAFAVYPIVTQAVGATAKVANAKNFGHDLDAFSKLISDKTRLIFIANPNNPTGTWLSKGELKAFLKFVPSHIPVVLDEAYFEYVAQENYPDGIKLLKKYPNVIVTRTFSKIYGLASLRVGYSISSPEVADLLNRVRQPFNVNSLAQAAAVAAINHKTYVLRTRELNEVGLAQIEHAFKALDLEFIPSVGNFIAFHVGSHRNAMAVYQSLLQLGVIVRPIENYQMPGFLRVSIGTEEENDVFLESLKAIIAQENL